MKKGAMEFVICARSRTGSTLLMSLLNSHPEVACRYEELKELNGRMPSDALEHAFRSGSALRAVGFKIFYYHPHDGDPAEVRRLLYSRPGLRAIHLTRRNLLDVHLSKELTVVTGEWRARGDEVPLTRLALSAKQIRGDHDTTIRYEEHERRLLAQAGIPTLEIVYEDLAADPVGGAQRCFDFLEVTPHQATSDFQKQARHAKSQVIENYDELRQSPLLKGLDRIIFDN